MLALGLGPPVSGLKAQATARPGSPQASLRSPWPWWLGRHPLLALTATLIVWGLIDVRSRGRIEPDNLVEHRTDFTVYTTAGAACFDGRDPYAVTNACAAGVICIRRCWQSCWLLSQSSIPGGRLRFGFS